MVAARGFDPTRGPFSTYATIGCRLYVRSWIRRNNQLAARPIHSVHNGEDFDGDAMVDAHPGPDAQAELSDLVDQCRRALPPRYWQILWLTYAGEGRTGPEVGVELGITRSAVEQILKVAKANCRKRVLRAEANCRHTRRHGKEKASSDSRAAGTKAQV